MNHQVTPNKVVIHRYYHELWNAWNLELIDQLIAEDIAFRGSIGTTVQGRAGFRQYVQRIRDAFPDFHNTIEEIIEEGDRVAARLAYRGTHLGELFGIAPTGREATYAGLALFRISDGLICEGFVIGDVTELKRQLEEIP